MGTKKGKRVRKIEVPTDSVPEFELGDTVADIQRRRQEREARKREEAQQQHQREEEARREEARAKKSHPQEEGIADFLKDQEELYDKTSEHFKDKTRKEFLWEQFAKSRKMSRCARPGLTHKGHIRGS